MQRVKNHCPAKYEIRNTKYEIAAGEDVYMKYKITAGKELLAPAKYETRPSKMDIAPCLK